jgi:hypothetical protein
MTVPDCVIFRYATCEYCACWIEADREEATDKSLETTERGKSQNQDEDMMPAKDVERAVDENTIDDICYGRKDGLF